MMVRAERDPVLLRSGRTAVDPRSIAAATGSIADLLRAVPGVEIDADGKVSLRGNAQVLVLINGRRTALTGEALVAYLRQMPAQTLERIETATTSSATQDANAAAGVVNLVFRDAEDAEHATPLRSVTATLASRSDYAASAAASGHAGRFVHWSTAFSSSESHPRTAADISRWTLLPGDLPYTTRESVRALSSHRLHSAMAATTVTPTPATSFGLRGTYTRMQGTVSTRRSAVYQDEAGNTAASSLANALAHDMPASELIGTASVQRGRARVVSELRGSLVHGAFRGDFDEVDAGFRYLRVATDSRQREFVLRNDLHLRLPGVDLTLGQESRRRRATAVHDATHFSTSDTRVFRHLSAVHAGFVSAERSAGAFRAAAGLRVERERDAVALDSLRTRAALRLFPSLSGEWTDASRGLGYRLAYGRRVTRPSWEMLNPLGMGDDGFGEYVGNADLRPEVVDQVEVGLERRAERLTAQLTPFLRWSRDAIGEIVTPNAQGGTRSPENLDWRRAYGADVGLRTRPADGIAMTVAGTVANIESARSSVRREGVEAALRVLLDLRLSERHTAQLIAAGRSRRTVEQGEELPELNSQLVLQRSMAKGRGKLTLQLSSPWRIHQRVLRDPGTFSDRVHRSSRRPMVGVFASFAVGGDAWERSDSR